MVLFNQVTDYSSTVPFGSTILDDGFTTEFFNDTFTDGESSEEDSGESSEDNTVAIVAGLLIPVLVIGIVALVAVLLYFFKCRKPQLYDETPRIRDENGEEQHCYDNVPELKEMPNTSTGKKRKENDYTPSPHGTPALIGANGESVHLHHDGTQETDIDGVKIHCFDNTVDLDDEASDNDTVYDNESDIERERHNSATGSNGSFYEVPLSPNENAASGPDVADDQAMNGHRPGGVLSQSDMIARILAKHHNTPPPIPKTRPRPPTQGNTKPSDGPCEKESFYLDMELSDKQGMIPVDNQDAKCLRSDSINTIDSSDMDDTYEIQ